VQEPAPVTAKHIADGRNDGDPNSRSQKVVDGKPSPLHP
jgi:hypothetical protein